MNSAENLMFDPSNDDVEPPSAKKLKVTTDTHDLNDGRNGNCNVAAVHNEEPFVSDTKLQPAETSAEEELANNEEEIEVQNPRLNPSFQQTTEDTASSLLSPVPNPLNVSLLSSSVSPTENRREALRGIVMGIKSPVTRAVIGYVHEEKPALVANPLPEPKLVVSKTDNCSKNPKVDKKKSSTDGHHLVKRRAPKKDPKPRLPLESRVFYSKKEIDSATAFLEGKEDLCECLPLDDCFLLGEMFWIFTVKQLELALDEKSSQNRIQEIITKIPNIPTATNVIKSTALGTAAITSDPQASASSIVDQSASRGSDRDTLMMEKGGIKKDEFSHSPESSPVDGVKGTSQQSPTHQDPSDGNGIVILDATAVNESESISNVPATMPETEMTPQDYEVILDGEVVMQERISFWRQAISTFRDQGSSKTEPQKRFRLDGPIKILFPQATLNFFKSIRLETLWTFMALRKSETGAICDLMNIWRRKCKMEVVVPDIGLGRHFLAISARIETVLIAFPPIPEKDRGWILDPISGITGAARDFLIRDRNIMSGVDFLDIKTKQLADILEVWRQDNGMEKLRGSGKVAMISAWKAYIKEALEVENDAGMVLDLSRYVAMVQNEKHVSMTTFVARNSKHSDIAVNSNTNQKGTSNLALHSKMALERALGDGATALLRSGGVQTAADLLTVDMSEESQLYKTLIETGIIDGMPAFLKALQKWRETIHQYLNKNSSEEDSTLSNLQSPYFKVVTHTGTPSTKKGNAMVSAPPTPLSSKAKSTVTADTVLSQPMTSPQSNKSLVNDPVYDTLSYTTKQFLASMGIHTAKDFLNTRSSELAVHFVPWRRAMGKPELKGMGSIASISGWKSQVRKKAKEMGL